MSSRAGASPATPPPRVTVLVDNASCAPSLRKEHGLSVWVEVGEHRLLIDTGETTAFLDNARRLGIGLEDADVIALSHGHYDHTGGLAAALETAPRAAVHMHPAALAPRYARRRRGRPEAIGMPEASRAAIGAAADRVVWSDAPTELVPGVWSTGSVPRDESRESGDPDFFFDEACTMADPVPDDQSFWIETPRGLWVIFGCAHAGVLATLAYIDVLSGGRPLVKVIGGTHLVRANAARIAIVADELARRAPDTVAPCHCTGPKASAALGRALPKAIVHTGAGAVIET